MGSAASHPTWVSEAWCGFHVAPAMYLRAALTWKGLTQILGFPHVLLGQCGFLSEMPVAHLSTELRVLSVLSFGHFFWVWVLILPWLFVFQICPLLFEG